MTNQVGADSTMPAGRRQPLLRAVHFLLLVTTLCAVGWEIQKAVRQLHDQPDAGLTFGTGWLATSAVGYALGLAILGVPWRSILKDAGANLSLLAVTRVYLISHVGKYVPGKAIVIVIRCGLLARSGVSAGVTILTSFYETFATMASGSASAAICLFLLPLPADAATVLSRQPLLYGVVLLLLAGFLASITPAGFRMFCAVVSIPFSAAKRPTWRAAPATMAISIIAGIVSWTVVGCSYLAAINAISTKPIGWNELPVIVACMAMSIVVGFVSMLPGQIGIRELVLIESLKPLVGDPVAVAAALLHRLVTLITELALAATLYLVSRRT